MFSCRCLLFFWSVGLISATAVAADIPKPPKPDPAKPVNYIAWINQTMGANVKENAAPFYRQAYDKFVPFEGDLGDTTSGPWSNNPKVSRWLTANRGALKLFRQAAAMRDCFYPLEDTASTGDPRRDHILMLQLLPNLQPHRQLCKALIAEGYQAWQNGDGKTLIANAVTVIRSGQHLENTTLLIQRLHGMACLALGHEAIRKALSLADGPDKLASEVIVQLRQMNPPHIPFSRALVSERLTTWDFCQRLFVPGKQAGTWSLYQPMVDGYLSSEFKSALGDDWDQFSKDFKKLPTIGFDATLQEVNAYFDEIEQWAAKPHEGRAGQAEHISRKRKSNANPIVRVIVADVAHARILDARTDAAHRATHLITLILAHHGATGKYPASLDELKSPDLKQIRTDPFRGRDFTYKKQAATFTLYSIADNLKDDGGQHDESWKTGDFVFWPVQQKPPAKAGG